MMQMLRSQICEPRFRVRELRVVLGYGRLIAVLGLQVELDGVRRKNEDLTQGMREKTRKHLQTQEMFDKLKRRSMLGQVQSAASHAVDDTIQASVAAHRYADRVGDPGQRQPPPPLFAPQQTASQQHSGPTSNSHNVESRHRIDGERDSNSTLSGSHEGMQRVHHK